MSKRDKLGQIILDEPPAQQDKPTESASRADGGKRQRPRSKEAIGRFQVINRFVDTALFHLSPIEALVWLVLWREVRNGVAEVSTRNIARRINRSRLTVIRALKRLELLGLVRVIYRGGMDRGISKYVVSGSISQQAETQPSITGDTSPGIMGDVYLVSQL